jgi:hypothetical protein
MKWAKLLLLFSFVALLVITVAAQNANTGTLFGIVSDPSGAVIPTATVTLHDVATGQDRSAWKLPGKGSCTRIQGDAVARDD